jgi:DUF1365 family protein
MVKLMKAKVFHKRIAPHNMFCYKAGYITMPLIGKFPNPKFFSINKFNVFSFYHKDHAQRNGSSTLTWVYAKLLAIGIKKTEISQNKGNGLKKDLDCTN